MILSFTLIFIILLHSSCSITINYNFGNCTEGQPFNVTCTEFDSWSKVNKAFSSIVCKNPPDPMYLKPSEPIVLTNELNISLVAFLKPVINSSIDYPNEIWLYGLSGVDVYPWPFCSNCVKKSLILSFSVIQFFVNKKPPSDYNCTPSLIPDDSATSVSFLSNYASGILANYLNTYGSRSQAICPYLFKNVNLVHGIQLFFQVDCFLFVSLFRFQTNDADHSKINRTSIISINSNVRELIVQNGPFCTK
jgi:hypothetical protein